MTQFQNKIDPDLFDPDLFYPDLLDPDLLDSDKLDQNLFDPDDLDPHRFGPLEFDPNDFEQYTYDPDEVAAQELVELSLKFGPWKLSPPFLPPQAGRTGTILGDQPRQCYSGN